MTTEKLGANEQVLTEKMADGFCQHCRSIQKVYGYKVKCWYNPLTEKGKHAWCASCLDLVEANLALLKQWYKGAGKEQCCYCTKKPDGAMLIMGNSMAHATCVIGKLNELLDPDFKGKGEPDKIVGILAGWKSPEEWQTEYLILERKAHSTGRREVIEWMYQRCPHAPHNFPSDKRMCIQCCEAELEECGQALQRRCR